MKFSVNLYFCGITGYPHMNSTTYFTNNFIKACQIVIYFPFNNAWKAYSSAHGEIILYQIFFASDQLSITLKLPFFAWDSSGTAGDSKRVVYKNETEKHPPQNTDRQLRDSKRNTLLCACRITKYL